MNAVDDDERVEHETADAPRPFADSPSNAAPDLQRMISGESALARELVALRPSTRARLGIHDDLVIVLDTLIALARALSDPGDKRPWPERFETAWSALPIAAAGDDLDTTGLEHLVAGISRVAADEVVEQVTRLSKLSPQRFIHRLVGEAAFTRLKSAVHDDGTVVMEVLRRALKRLMPLALALDDSATFLTPGQIAEIEGMGALSRSALAIAVDFDRVLDRVLTDGWSSLDALAESADMRADGQDLAAIAAQVQEVLGGHSRATLEDLSSRLSRKVQGARDVLDVSADANSQAANSLVEFVDRLLRRAFDDQAVLEFVRDRYPEVTEGLTYIKPDTRAVTPTKKAQALCFAYAGRTTGEPVPFLDLAASGLVQARAVLQPIKHADTGSVSEREQVRNAIRAIEGFLVFAVRVGWAGAEREQVHTLRKRLGE